MLRRADLEFSSLYWYIKEGVLANLFSTEVQNEPLVYDPNLHNGAQRTDYRVVSPASIYGRQAKQKGRGWLSFEIDSQNTAEVYSFSVSGYVPTYGTEFFNQSFSIPTKREQNYVKVYDQSGNLLDRSWYQVDYTNNRIRYPISTTPSGAVTSGIHPDTADYRFHSVSVLEGWPQEATLPDLPFVAIYPVSESCRGYQLGGGVEFKTDYIIDVYANNSQLRRELLSTIHDGLYNRHCPVIDFNRTGQPLEQWGRVNKEFIQTVSGGGQTYRTYLILNGGNGSLIYFYNLETKYDINPRSNQSEVLQYRGQIRFSTSTYTDRDPNLVGKFSGMQPPIGGFDSLIKNDLD